jgi:hypothetical protein
VNWLGIAILLAFSLGLTLFMRLEPGKPRKRPPQLGEWQRREGAPGEPEAAYLERRLWLYDGGWLRPHRLVEQSRVRAESDGRILRALPERLVERWRGRAVE